MSDTGDPPDEWARWLKRMTDRPGWSVARLAREAQVHRSTIFRWMADGGGPVTIDSVRAVARALDVPIEVALRAAADLPPVSEERVDEELELIRAADLDPDLKLDILRELMARREREQSARIQDLRFLVDRRRAAR